MSPHPAHATTALRGDLVYCIDDPFLSDPAQAFVHQRDGLVICENGLITAVGPYEETKALLPPGTEITHYPDCLIAPGFVDTHVHYVQTGMIGAYGDQLLDWLNDYTFVAEQEFRDKTHATAMASFFCDELLRNGTTTALVFCAVYPQSVDALFEEAEARNMRLIAGKVLMDRNAPSALLDTAQQGYDESKALIQKWHGRGRALYAITPRFAATSTAAQLDLAGTLWREHPGVHMQSHIAESPQEVAWMRELFPARKHYFDIYEHHGLTGPRALLAHGIHLSEEEFCRCADTGTALAHCPTSNLFLGSGLFRVFDAKHPKRPVRVGLGSDIGAGTSFSLLATLNEAYKISQLQGRPLDAIRGFFLATLGGARALYLDQKIGTLRVGHEADMVVLDPRATPLLKFRSERVESIEEMLFVLMTLGDDRAIKATYVAGKPTHISGKAAD